jgi:hypothetical protein
LVLVPAMLLMVPVLRLVGVLLLMVVLLVVVLLLLLRRFRMHAVQRPHCG